MVSINSSQSIIEPWPWIEWDRPIPSYTTYTSTAGVTLLDVSKDKCYINGCGGLLELGQLVQTGKDVFFKVTNLDTSNGQYTVYTLQRVEVVNRETLGDRLEEMVELGEVEDDGL